MCSHDAVWSLRRTKGVWPRARAVVGVWAGEKSEGEEVVDGGGGGVKVREGAEEEEEEVVVWDDKVCGIEDVVVFELENRCEWV